MITLRPMQAAQADYLHMQRWFHEPALQQWVWCDEPGEPPVSIARIAEKYGPRAAHPTDVFPYFILKDGAPIGFIQYYIHSAETIGLDMWIGVPDERNRGCGSEALRQMVDIIHRRAVHRPGRQKCAGRPLLRESRFPPRRPVYRRRRRHLPADENPF